jgi:hypothetical protein
VHQRLASTNDASAGTIALANATGREDMVNAWQAMILHGEMIV